MRKHSSPKIPFLESMTTLFLKPSSLVHFPPISPFPDKTWRDPHSIEDHDVEECDLVPFQVKVKIVSSDERKELDKTQMETDLEEQRGFSQVIELIIENKKPIVGHNCLFDLVRIYQQFIDDLPSTLERFRSQLHILFPEIYDTKLLALNLKRDQDHKSSGKQLHCFARMHFTYPNGSRWRSRGWNSIYFAVALTETRLDKLQLALSGQNPGYQVPHSPTIVMDKETGQIYGISPNSFKFSYHTSLDTDLDDLTTGMLGIWLLSRKKVTTSWLD